MPVWEPSPWRLQYFSGVVCPPDVNIPADDPEAWAWNPAHRWIYDRLRIAETQGLEAAPHGVAPPGYPVFSKPQTNIRGMGIGSRVLASADDYERHLTPGHIWMRLLEGDHLSTDCAVVDGEVRWLRHSHGVPAGDGMFDYWVIEPGERPAIAAMLRAWVSTHLSGYTGMFNAETIGDHIIEAHLRFADQWPDLYGAGWVAALVGLYAERRWDFAPPQGSAPGYSVILFGRHGAEFTAPPEPAVNRIRALPHVSSVQITFRADQPMDSHAAPPGGVRLAIVNATDLTAGRAAREELARLFPAADLIARRS